MNFNISIDLAKLKHASVAKLKGSTGAVKRCLVVPIEDNPAIFESERGGVYMNLTAWERKDESDYGTHYVKGKLPKTEREKITRENRGTDDPIYGNMKPFSTGRESQSTGSYGWTAPESDEDLPF